MEFPLSIKFHPLLHYPRLVTTYGPPVVFSTINFESLHSHLKSNIKSSKIWRLICHTVVTKYPRSKLFIKESLIQEIGSAPYFYHSPNPLDILTYKTVKFLRSLKWKNCCFRCYMTAILINNEEHNIEFLEIEKIFKLDASYIFFGKLLTGFKENNVFILVL